MRFDVLTLHPAMCEAPLAESILGRARAAGLIEVGVTNLRDFGLGRHKVVDDTPYGGGSGMVMRVDVVDQGIASVRRPDSRVLLMDPAGARFTAADAVRLAAYPHLVLVCGHYEGIDARVREHLVDEALSIGDYVLTGGELAALVIVDAVARQVPGVLGNADVRKKLVDLMPKLSNAAVRFVAVSVIDKFSPKGDKALADSLQKIVSDTEASRDANKMAANAPFKTIIYRLNARAQ